MNGTWITVASWSPTGWTNRTFCRSRIFSTTCCADSKKRPRGRNNRLTILWYVCLRFITCLLIYYKFIILKYFIIERFKIVRADIKLLVPTNRAETERPRFVQCGRAKGSRHRHAAVQQTQIDLWTPGS